MKETCKGVNGIQFIIFSIGIIIYFHLANCSMYNETGLILGNLNYNIVAYAGALIFGLLLFGILCFINNKIKKNELNYIRKMVYLSFAGFVLLFLYYVYQDEYKLFSYQGFVDTFARESMPHTIFTAIMLVLIITIFFIMRKANGLGKYFRISISVQISFLCALLTYLPNIFRNTLWGLPHAHAYTNSIVNAARLIPYDDVRSSIYGHYGILYIPFVKLLGNDYRAIAITIALFTFVLFIATCYVVSSYISHDGLFGIAVIALGAVRVNYFFGGQYFQILPQRYFFPFLALAFIIWQMNTHTDRRYIKLFEVIFGVLSVIWNLEMGLCTLVSICVFHISKEKMLGRIIKKCIDCIVYFLMCVGMAYIVVNFYNLLLGGEWNSVYTFIYPIGSQEYDMFKILRTPLPHVNAGHTVQSILFMYSAYKALYRLWFCASESICREREIISLTIATSGIVSLVYFINRTAAGNLSISHIQFVMLLAMYGEECLKIKKDDLREKLKEAEKLFKTLMSAISLMLVIWFAFEGILDLGKTINSRVSNDWYTKSLEESIVVLQNRVPKDTLAFGTGMPELYYEMGWNPQIAITDWSDMNYYSMTEVKQVLELHDSFIMMENTKIDIPDEFVLVDRIETKDFVCVYYQKQKGLY